MDRRARAGRIAKVLFADALVALQRAAQQQGPLPPPPPGTIAPPVAAPRKDVAPAVAQRDATSEISTAAPSVPVEQIIKQFAARGEEVRKGRGNYTHTTNFFLHNNQCQWLPS